MANAIGCEEHTTRRVDYSDAPAALPNGQVVPAAPILVDIDDVEGWEDAPIVTEPSFSQKASLKIAWAVLGIFGGAYLGVFIMAFCMLKLEDATFDGALELVKFLVSAILPIVTLAVGYYLGEKTGNTSPTE